MSADITAHVRPRNPRAPQTRLDGVNGHDHRSAPTLVVLPLPAPCVDIDLVRLERIAAHQAAAEATLRARVVAHDMPALAPAARSLWTGYFALMAAIVAVALYAWWLR